MEMTYDGMLVMPSSYAVMDEEEMRYVEGGISLKTAKDVCLTVIAAAVTYVLGEAISKSMIGAALKACAAWVATTIDLTIITIIACPFKTAACVVAGAALGVVTYAVIKAGKKKGYF